MQDRQQSPLQVGIFFFFLSAQQEQHSRQMVRACTMPVDTLSIWTQVKLLVLVLSCYGHSACGPALCTGCVCLCCTRLPGCQHSLLVPSTQQPRFFPCSASCTDNMRRTLITAFHTLSYTSDTDVHTLYFCYYFG